MLHKPRERRILRRRAVRGPRPRPEELESSPGGGARNVDGVAAAVGAASRYTGDDEAVGIICAPQLREIARGGAIGRRDESPGGRPIERRATGGMSDT